MNAHFDIFRFNNLIYISFCAEIDVSVKFRNIFIETKLIFGNLIVVVRLLRNRIPRWMVFVSCCLQSKVHVLEFVEIHYVQRSSANFFTKFEDLRVMKYFFVVWLYNIISKCSRRWLYDQHLFFFLRLLYWFNPVILDKLGAISFLLL